MIRTREELVKRLWPSKHVSDLDVGLFLAWERGETDTVSAIMEFKKNNRIRENIEPSMFEKWLNSLGYRRAA